MKTIKQILNISEPRGPGMGRFAPRQCRLGLTGQETLPFTSTPCERMGIPALGLQLGSPGARKPGK